MSTRRDELVQRIASNKAWLSKNWHQGKDMRRPCQANIEADERALAKLDERGTASAATRIDQPLSKNTRHRAYIEHDLESLCRGGSSRTAMCLCGWRGPQRATLELAADDALTHEGSDMHIVAKRDESK